MTESMKAEVQAAETQWIETPSRIASLSKPPRRLRSAWSPDFAQGLCVHRALETCTPKAPTKDSVAVTRLPRKGIEAGGEPVFIDPKGNDTGFRLPRLDWAAWSGRHLVRLHWARSSKTARASSRESACRELERTLRAKLPKVSAVGVSPTSALPCLNSGSILPVGKAFSRKCFSSCFDSGSSGSGFL